MDNLRASTALLTSNVLVCLALILLRHSAADALVRSFYLLAANGIAGLLGFFPPRKENELKLDRSFLAVALWSACYCAEYGIFLVYPRLISLSQLIVCNSLAPLAAVYLSQDGKRTRLKRGAKIFAIAPVMLLLGISYLERVKGVSSGLFAWAILLVVLACVVCSQSCARYVARTKSPTWSQPRLTSLNAIFLSVVLCIALGSAKVRVAASVNFILCLGVGAMILVIQRLYVYGLERADPFISAMTLCTIVPISLGAQVLFEHRAVGIPESALAVGYVLTNAILVRVRS
jgi:hypothetical protein